MTGATYFVDRNNSQGNNDGYSTNPHRTVQAGASAASSSHGNIVIIRPGSYNEQMEVWTAETCFRFGCTVSEAKAHRTYGRCSQSGVLPPQSTLLRLPDRHFPTHPQHQPS